MFDGEQELDKRTTCWLRTIWGLGMTFILLSTAFDAYDFFTETVVAEDADFYNLTVLDIKITSQTTENADIALSEIREMAGNIITSTHKENNTHVHEISFADSDYIITEKINQIDEIRLEGVVILIEKDSLVDFLLYKSTIITIMGLISIIWIVCKNRYEAKYGMSLDAEINDKC